MTFQEALHEECRKCGETAANHRLTKGDVFYCLIGKTVAAHCQPVKVWASKVKVSELVKSPLPTSIGQTINEGLGTFV